MSKNIIEEFAEAANETRGASFQITKGSRRGLWKIYFANTYDRELKRCHTVEGKTIEDACARAMKWLMDERRPTTREVKLYDLFDEK